MFRHVAAAAFASIALIGVSNVHAGLITYQAQLSGPAEAPPNASPGLGQATVVVDADANTMRVIVSFSGLLAVTTAAHIHGPTPNPLEGTAGVATTTPTFPFFPLGVTSGSYDQTFDLLAASSYNPAFVTANGGTTAGAQAALLAALASQRAYLNIHTAAFPAGEIRGFLQAAVPEPSSLASMGLGVMGLVGWAIARRGRSA